jgi:hypothetical protein
VGNRLREWHHQHEQVEQEGHEVAQAHLTGSHLVPAVAQHHDECTLDAQGHDRLDQCVEPRHIHAGAVRGRSGFTDSLGLPLGRAGRPDRGAQSAFDPRGHVADACLSPLAGSPDGIAQAQYGDRTDEHSGQREQQQRDVDVRHQRDGAEEHQDR